MCSGVAGAHPEASRRSVPRCQQARLPFLAVMFPVKDDDMTVQLLRLQERAIGGCTKLGIGAADDG